MAKVSSPTSQASRERERAWNTLCDTDQGVTPQSINSLVTASWKEIQLQEKRSKNDPSKEPASPQDEITNVDLLRWASEKPQTVLGRAATLVWLEGKLEHYQGQLSSRMINGYFYGFTEKNRIQNNQEARFIIAEKRSRALKQAIQLLTRKGPTLVMDTQSAQYAEMAKSVTEQRQREHAQRREALHAGFARLRANFSNIFGPDTL